MARVAIEVLQGVGESVHREMTGLLPDRHRVLVDDDTEIAVEVDEGDLAALQLLRTAVATYVVVPFPDVVRPRSLLSPDRLRTIAGAIAGLRRRAAPARFRSFRLSAAGSDSDELRRLRAAVAEGTGLVDDPDEGDLLIRLRKARLEDRGWEVLLRTTPRPLSARPWRTERFEGGLNATVAAAVVMATAPAPEDRFVDLMCGGGTLLIERLAVGLPSRIVGCDVSSDALDVTRIHLRNAKVRGARVELLHADVTTLEPCAGPFDKLVVNLPWGTLVGSHEDNDQLYPAVLAAAARVSTAEARLCVLTHDVRRFEAVLADDDAWVVERTWRFFQKGHHPRLYALGRRA